MLAILAGIGNVLVLKLEDRTEEGLKHIQLHSLHLTSHFVPQVHFALKNWLPRT